MNKLRVFLAALLCALGMLSASVFAAELDRILDYEIEVSPRQDGTLDMVYSIEWKVLSNAEGPLTWVKIGVPNSNIDDYEALSDSIDYVSLDYNGGTYMLVYFKKSYRKDDIVKFSFKIHQDYMYEMNTPTEGSTQYTFTPGWFDDIKIEKLLIKWKCDKATSWSPSCLNKDGYLTWEASLDKGNTKTINVVYPNDAFTFDESKFNIIDDYDSYDYVYNDHSDRYYEEEDTEQLVVVIGAILFILIFTASVFSSVASYSSSSNLGETKKKITRTVIKYYESCPSCGGQRVPDGTVCQYCGRSMVESEKVIREDLLKKEYKDAGRYKEEGTFPYASMPNTYIRVHVTRVPVSNSSRKGGGCVHSSCVHSSCACAHSCACACACACAGGGRAGCTEKDFYNTGLKLKALELKKKKRNK